MCSGRMDGNVQVLISLQRQSKWEREGNDNRAVSLNNKLLMRQVNYKLASKYQNN